MVQLFHWTKECLNMVSVPCDSMQHSNNCPGCFLFLVPGRADWTGCDAHISHVPVCDPLAKKRGRAVSDDENSNSGASSGGPDKSLAAKLRELGSDSESEDERSKVTAGKKDEKALFGSDSDSGDEEEWVQNSSHGNVTFYCENFNRFYFRISVIYYTKI